MDIRDRLVQRRCILRRAYPVLHVAYEEATMTRELILEIDESRIADQPVKAIDDREPVGYLIATNTFGSTAIELFKGSNSFGEPGIFCGAEPGNHRAFAALRGYPQYAAQQWLRDRGYTYQVT